MKKICVKILGNEKTQFIAIPVFSILLSLIVEWSSSRDWENIL